MQKNKLVILNLAAIACVFGTAGGSLAQTVALTSSTWDNLAGSTLFFGPPVFGVNLTGPTSGSFGAVSLTPGTSTTVTFSPSKFFMTVINSGVAGTMGSGSNQGNFTFNIAGGSASVAVPITYTVTDTANGISSDLVTVSSTTQLFNIVSGGTQVFSFKLNNNSGNIVDNGAPQTLSPITGTLTFLGTAPEPGTLALLSLGVMPVVVAVRRRRK